MTIVFDGRRSAGELEKKLLVETTKFKHESGIMPKVVDFIIGDDQASILYAKMKKKTAERIGMEMEIQSFPKTTNTNEVVREIDRLNRNPKVHGILIQLPLPKQFEKDQPIIINKILPSKDVDCLTSENLELLKIGKPRFMPATVRAIIQIIRDASFIIRNSNICIVGASGMVGKPLSDYLKFLGGKVTDCDENTRDLASATITADLLISSTGVPKLIKQKMIRPGAVVFDVGSPRGDVDFDKVKKAASIITPVPGGVGPMTVISLLENTLEAAALNSK